MLFWADDNHPVTDIPKSRKPLYEAGLGRLSKSEKMVLRDYINQQLNNALTSCKKEITFFIPGWVAGAEWDPPLDMIWEKVFHHDHSDCAKWYGLFVMDTIIQREDKWYGNKTNFNRPLDQTVYWFKDH